MQYPLFYNSIKVDGVDDRPYDADSFADWLKKFFTTGVFKDELQVSAVSGMGISVSAGYVNINGKVMEFATTPLTIGTADGTYYRIDSVIIERNDTDRQFYIKVVQGNTGTESSVTGVTPVRSGAVYQLVIARIMVRPGATAITQADITDTRADSDLCGIVAGTVDAMDFDQFKAQFDSYFDAFKTGKQADFESWFANIQDVLDEDTAGHLQNEIDAKADQADLTAGLAGKVNRAGDDMTGNLTVTTENTAGFIKVGATQGGTAMARGGMWATVGGNFGFYDDINRRWILRSDLHGNHLPVTLSALRTAKVTCSSVGTSYKYTTVSTLENWDMVAIRLTVCENSQLLFFVRGESHERSLTDWPNAGKFRGGLYVDWTNNRIGLRCLNAGANNDRKDLVYFDYVYGVM